MHNRHNQNVNPTANDRYIAQLREMIHSYSQMQHMDQAIFPTNSIPGTFSQVSRAPEYSYSNISPDRNSPMFVSSHSTGNISITCFWQRIICLRISWFKNRIHQFHLLHLLTTTTTGLTTMIYLITTWISLNDIGPKITELLFKLIWWLVISVLGNRRRENSCTTYFAMNLSVTISVRLMGV